MNIDHLLSAMPLIDGPKLAIFGPRTESVADELNRLDALEPVEDDNMELSSAMMLVLEKMKDHIVIDGSTL